MRKRPRHRNATSQLSTRRALQLSQETIRTLTSDELSQAVSGCPTGSYPTTQGAVNTDTCA